MSCGCNGTQLQGEQFCQDCMPDEFSWLVPVDSKPDPFLMDRNHAYITPNNNVYVLDHSRTKSVPLGGGPDVDWSQFALKTELQKKAEDLLKEITKVKALIKNYSAGTNIEITDEGVINNTYSDEPLKTRIKKLEDKPSNTYTAGTGITISPTNEISTELDASMLERAIETSKNNIISEVSRMVTDTEINLQSANLGLNNNTLTWKGVLNTGKEVNSSVQLPVGKTYSLAREGNNIVLTGSDNSRTSVADSDTKYTAGNGLVLTGTTFSADTDTLATKASVDELNTRLTAEEQKPDNDTKYTAGKAIAVSGTNVIDLKYSTDFRLTSGNELDMNPAWLATTLKTYNTDLIKVTQVGENTFLDLAGIKRYIDTRYKVTSRSFERVTSNTFTFSSGNYNVPLSPVPSDETVVKEELAVNLGAGSVSGYNIVNKRNDMITFSSGVYRIVYNNTNYGGNMEIYFPTTGILISTNVRFTVLGNTLSVLPSSGYIIFGYRTGNEVVEPLNIFASSTVNISKTIGDKSYRLKLTSPVTLSLKTTTIKIA